MSSLFANSSFPTLSPSTDFFSNASSDVATPSPTTDPTVDMIGKTFSSITTAIIVVPIVVGVVIIAIIVACVCRSKRVKKENAEQAARSLELRRQAEHAEQSPALPHAVLVSPTAPTYNASIMGGNAVPLALAVPSAPTADLDEQQLAYEIALQQRELDRYKNAPVRPQQSPPQQHFAPPPQQHYAPPPQPYYAPQNPVHQPPAPIPQPVVYQPPPPQSVVQQPPPPPQQQPQAQPWDDAVITASRIPMDALYTNLLISKGGFGEVYKGSYRGQTVAMKKLLPETRRDLKQIAGFFAEIKLMATMEHERIVRYIGVAWDALSDVCAVTEFMEGGDLRSALTKFESVDHRPQGIDKQKATLALHVAHALTYMHSLQPEVLHRDLKSKNILLDETQWSAKLTDFGVSRERSDNTMTAAVGTILWMAPEVMAGDRYDDKADIFSFGIVLSELDTHAMPYADVKARLVSESGRPLPETALLQRIMSGRVSVSFSSGLREDIRALGQSCVALDPSKRPTAGQLLYELHKIMNSL